jgi:hypothetical protein
MVKAWLTRQSSLDEIVAQEQSAESDEFKAQARALIEAFQPGDEVWRFRSPADTWQMRMGRAGVALVRNHEIVQSLLTMMN